jgi:hypothetical protein
MEVSGQHHAPAALPRGNRTWCSLTRGLGGPQSRYGRFGEEENFLHLPIFEPQFRGRSARSIVTIQSTLAYILHTVTVVFTCQCAARIVRDWALRRSFWFVSAVWDRKAESQTVRTCVLCHLYVRICSSRHLVSLIPAWGISVTSKN